jgi:hypothetical protein
LSDKDPDSQDHAKPIKREKKGEDDGEKNYEPPVIKK